MEGIVNVMNPKLSKFLTILFCFSCYTPFAQKPKPVSPLAVEKASGLELVTPGDVLLSEILFNPLPGGVDYVELFNRSGKNISLQELFLASRDREGEIVQKYPLAKIPMMLSSGKYLLITSDTLIILQGYSVPQNAGMIQLKKLPSYNNDKDVVVLLDEQGTVIDELHYSEEMHHDLLKDPEGVALERVSFEKATNLPSNWYSATALSGYGTPGRKNSVQPDVLMSGIDVAFSPESFSPNLDGYNDEYYIKLNTDKPGYFANVWIFDKSGFMVTRLAENVALGNMQTISWNGRGESGEMLSSGIYVSVVEVFSLSGGFRRFKDAIVLVQNSAQ